MTQTVVMITISDLGKDSRTYKQALSLCRFGYRCIVLQGEEGSLDAAMLPFELRTIGRPYTGKKEKPLSISQSISSAPSPKRKSRWKDKLPYWMRYGIPFARYLYRDYSYQRRVEAQIPDADLYYIHYYDLFPAVSVRAKAQGSPVIYDAHDFHSGLKPIETLSTLERVGIKPFQKRKEAECIRACHGVVTVGEGIAALMDEAFDCKARVIRNCHDARLDRYDGPSLRKKLGLSPADRLLVTIGNAKPCMAYAQVFEAFERLPENTHLAFVGQGYEPYLAKACPQALRQRIHAPGAVKPFEIVPFVRDADAALILYFSHSANSYHCLPNGFFQSLAAGLPLLYPALPEISRIASQYDLGLPMNPLDTFSIKQAIGELLDSPDQLKKYRWQCQLANTELNWESEELVFKELIEKALTHKGIKV